MNRINLLIFVSLLGCIQFGVAQHSIPEFPFLFVTGEGSVEAETTHAIIHLRIEAKHEEGEQAEQAFRKKSQQVKKQIGELGASIVQSHQINKRKITPSANHHSEPDPFGGGTDQSSPPQSNVNPYFEISQSIVCRVDDLETYPQVVTSLVSSNHVDNYSVEFESDKAEEVQHQVRVAAVKNASKKAKSLCDASGTSIMRIHAISEEPFRQLGRLVGEEDYRGGVAYSMDAPSIYTVPKTVYFAQSIYVLFQLDE